MMEAVRAVLSASYCGAVVITAVIVSLVFLIVGAYLMLASKLGLILSKLDAIEKHNRDEKRAAQELEHFQREVASGITIIRLRLRTIRHLFEQVLKEKA